MTETWSRKKTYWEILKECKTPIIFCWDAWYKTVPRAEVQEQCEIPETYIIDFFDCEDMAYVMKGHFSKKQLNGIGLVWGKYGSSLHVWNVFLDEETGKAVQADPMTDKILEDTSRYRAYVVML